MYNSGRDDEEFEDMEGIDLDVSVDRVLKYNDDADNNSNNNNNNNTRDERLARFARRALLWGLAIVALIAATVGIAAWLRQENKQTVPSSISPSFDDDAKVPTSTLSHRNNVNDCWMVLYGNVYNMTSYNHPGPQQWITANCGSDATAEYTAAHPEVYMRTIEHLYVGVYESNGGLSEDLTGNASVGECMCACCAVLPWTICRRDLYSNDFVEHGFVSSFHLASDQDDISSNNTTTDNTENDDIPANDSSNSSSVTDPQDVEDDSDNNLPFDTSIIPDEDQGGVEIINGPFYNTSAADKDDVADGVDENQPTTGGIFVNGEEENEEDDADDVKDEDEDKDDERTFDVQDEDSDQKKEKEKNKTKDKEKGKGNKKKEKTKDDKKKKN